MTPLLRHRVVFFRDQALDHATQIRFGRYFGELTYAHPHDDSPPDGFPEIYTVDVKRFVDRYGEPHLPERRTTGASAGTRT